MDTRRDSCSISSSGTTQGEEGIASDKYATASGEASGTRATREICERQGEGLVRREMENVRERIMESEELCGRSDELQIETECCRDVEGGVRGVQSIVRKQCHGIEEGRPLEVSVRATTEGSSAELREEVQYVGQEEDDLSDHVVQQNTEVEQNIGSKDIKLLED